MYKHGNELDMFEIAMEVDREKARPPQTQQNAGAHRNAGANGVLAWLPDRLWRNSIDSGRIIYMLDINVLCDLKFPHFWVENTPQGKYMLANDFNSSKQYVDNLSVNTKRGLRQKSPRGSLS